MAKKPMAKKPMAKSKKAVPKSKKAMVKKSVPKKRTPKKRMPKKQMHMEMKKVESMAMPVIGWDLESILRDPLPADTNSVDYVLPPEGDAVSEYAFPVYQWQPAIDS